MIALAAAGCGGQRDTDVQAQSLNSTAVAVVRELFVTTPFDSSANIDGPAVYHGSDGTHWLIATAKTSNVLFVYDATTGALIRKIGRTGSGKGELRRPNGIMVLGDSLVFVVERDNARVQAFRLPDFTSVGTFGERLLRLPYGIAAVVDTGSYVVYVTDNYETADGQAPPDSALGERIREFRVSVNRGKLVASLLKTFGDTVGEGVVRTIESIAADRVHDRLLIAEETETDSHIKVYNLAGRFTGQIMGRGRFPQQAEGIALYECGNRDGYWITTDQGDSTNTFHVFDRATLSYVGAFTGLTTRRTDGVAVTARAFGPFLRGAFFGSHLDGAVGALAWSDIAAALKLRVNCH